MVKNKQNQADIGIIGGTGFYSLLKNHKSITVNTPYGVTSSAYRVGKIAGKKVAFLPRHGVDHQYPPHKIPYRANMFGFKKLGCKFIISPCASGSLQKNVKPGDFVIGDQFVDRTKMRLDTFFDGPVVKHVAMDKPYCSYLRKKTIKIGQSLKYEVHKKGTVVVINGPRFSSKAESQWFSNQGWEVINMTQYPELILARELEMCFVNISLITDYDVGIKELPEIEPVSTKQVLQVFQKNLRKIKIYIKEIIKDINVHYKCSCHKALENA